jgi:SAM-dependent methyltransferase
VCCFAPATEAGVPVFAPRLADGDGSDADYTFEQLSDAQSWHFWFVRRAALLSWAVNKYFPDARSFLEVGCGTGGVAAAIARANPSLRVTAVDTRLAGLAYAKRRAPDLDIIQCDARELPFDSEFDVGGAFDVIEHIDDDVSALAAVRDVVKPGGGILITVPQHPWLWSAVDEFSHHRRRYTRAELRAKLAEAGLEVIRMTSFVTTGLPILWVSRRIPRRFDVQREFKISATANTVLGWLLGAEHSLIAAGASLPVGTSLLAVARRPNADRTAA